MFKKVAAAGVLLLASSWAVAVPPAGGPSTSGKSATAPSGAPAASGKGSAPSALPPASAAPGTAPAASAAPSAGRAPASAPAAPGASGVPTWWVLMVTGEKNGAPWMTTTTPETLGGTVKNTGPWNCRYPSTERGDSDGAGWERLELSCAVGEAEVFLTSQCNFRTKRKAGMTAGKSWKRGELQTLNLRRQGDAKSVITVSLRCDVDAALATN